MSAITTEPAQVCQYEFEVTIDGDATRVWKALTDQVGAWWLPDFHILGADSLVTLEAKPGGRLYEENGETGLLWYTVLSVTPGESINLSGYCTAAFGGPFTTLLSVSLKEDNGKTTVSVTDALYGRVSESQASSLRSGWQDLFDRGLKKFVESN